jgi:hypothetical protein
MEATMALSKNTPALSRRIALAGLAALSTTVLSKSADAMGKLPEREEPATDEQWAAIEFEPWQHAEGEWTPPSNKEMIEAQLQPTRLAWALLYKTKGELMASIAAMNVGTDGELDHCCDLIEHLTGVANNYRVLADMIDSAWARLLCAATAVELKVVSSVG